MSEKPLEWLITQGVLGVASVLLIAAAIWLVRRIETLHEAHKQEMRDNGKALISLLEKTHSAIDRLFELEERRRQ